MMQYVVFDGNLLDELPFDSNLLAKAVKMMFLPVNSDVWEKGIPISAGEMKQEIFLNVHVGFMKETHVWMQFIR